MKYVVGAILIAVFGFIFLLVKDWGECSFNEEYAKERVLNALAKSQDPRHLSESSFNKGDCSYSYLYEDETNKISYVFTGWGEVHKWDHSRDK